MTIRILNIPLMALCFLSCSSSGQDEAFITEPTPSPTPAPDNVSIAFGGNGGAWKNAPTTRAEGIGLETLTNSFRVWAYKSQNQLVMNAYKVQHINDTEETTDDTDNTDGEWQYIGIKDDSNATGQTVKFWDFAATDYRFYAYAPADAAITHRQPDANNTTASFTIPYAYTDEAHDMTTPYVSRLWYSDNKNTKNKYGECATMTFTPLIAKVRFRFSYPDDTESITIHDITFRDSRFDKDQTTANTPLKGNIIVTYPADDTNGDTPQLEWTTSTAEGATGLLQFTVPYETEDDPITVNDPAQYNKWYYVPPLNDIPYQQGPYTITANINGNHTSATVPAQYMQWKAGYQYTYVFKITEAGTYITFSDLMVEKWVEGAGYNNNVSGNGTEGW